MSDTCKISAEELILALMNGRAEETFRPEAQIEIDTSSGIPKMSVGFRPGGYLPEEVAGPLRKKGILSKGEGKGEFVHLYAYTWWTFMNFRRYSWGWAPGRKAEYGYAYGSVWANGIDGGFTCETPQQVIRETLARDIESFSKMVPQEVLRSIPARAAFGVLAEEAMNNARAIEWASRAVGSHNGSLHKVVLSVDGKEVRAPFTELEYDENKDNSLQGELSRALA